MRNTFLKITFSGLIFLSVISCANDKKQTKGDSEKTETAPVETKAEKKNKEKAYYKKAIQDVLNSSSEYAYYKGATGVNTFIKGGEIICFLDIKNETEEIYNDKFFTNVYRPEGKESLSFEFIDFEKDDIKIDNANYMLAVFKFSDVEVTSSIQVGQYSKDQKKITWKVLIPKGRFHK